MLCPLVWPGLYLVILSTSASLRSEAERCPQQGPAEVSPHPGPFSAVVKIEVTIASGEEKSVVDAVIDRAGQLPGKAGPQAGAADIAAGNHRPVGRELETAAQGQDGVDPMLCPAFRDGKLRGSDACLDTPGAQARANVKGARL